MGFDSGFEGIHGGGNLTVDGRLLRCFEPVISGPERSVLSLPCSLTGCIHLHRTVQAPRALQSHQNKQNYVTSHKNEGCSALLKVYSRDKHPTCKIILLSRE